MVSNTAILHLNMALQELGLEALQDDECRFHTSARWLKFIEEFMQPFAPQDVLGKVFESQGDPVTMVVQANIPYRAICAHHLVPVLGKAHVGYIPKKAVVGLSKLARLVHGLSHTKPSLQEDVGEDVVNALTQYLDPIGAACVIAAEHGCMACRGIAEPGVATVTSSFRGAFLDPSKGAAARAEFFELVKMHPAFL